MTTTTEVTDVQRFPLRKAIWLGIFLAYSAGLVLHLLHGGQHEAVEVDPTLHWLRNSTLAVPMAVAVSLVSTLLSRGLLRRGGLLGSRAWESLGWSLLAALGYAAATIPGNAVHGRLFGASPTSARPRRAGAGCCRSL